MKQQILNLKKKLLLVELPEGIVAPEKSDNICIIQDIICFRTSNMKPTMRSFGKLTNITEEQFVEWVHDNGLGCYDNYKGIVDNKYTCLTAKESFFSYLERQGILFSNPLGKRPFVSIFDTNPDSVVRKGYYKWEEAESKVWDISNCYLFKILN
jgi:hypothetical protein